MFLSSCSRCFWRSTTTAVTAAADALYLLSYIVLWHTFMFSHTLCLVDLDVYLSMCEHMVACLLMKVCKAHEAPAPGRGWHWLTNRWLPEDQQRCFWQDLEVWTWDAFDSTLRMLGLIVDFVCDVTHKVARFTSFFRPARFWMSIALHRVR